MSTQTRPMIAITSNKVQVFGEYFYSLDTAGRAYSRREVNRQEMRLFDEAERSLQCHFMAFIIYRTHGGGLLSEKTPLSPAVSVTTVNPRYMFDYLL